MRNNEIAREVSAILSKEYGGSSKRSFQLARSLVKLVADRLTKRAADGDRFCPACHSLLEENSVYCDNCGTDTPRR